MIIAKTNQEDLNEIFRMENAYFKKPWTLKQIKDSYNNDTNLILVLKHDEYSGFAIIAFIDTVCEIYRIAVDESIRKLGFGTRLLDHICTISREKNCSSIILEVNETNHSALHFYQKNSFQIIDKRKKYYNNTDNAIVMEKNI